MSKRNKKKPSIKKTTKKKLSAAKIVMGCIVSAALLLSGVVYYNSTHIQLGDCVKLISPDAAPYARTITLQVIEDLGNDLQVVIVDAGDPQSQDDIQLLFSFLMSERLLIRKTEFDKFQEVKCPVAKTVEKPSPKQTETE